MQIAPEQEARHLVVEADRVVAHAHRAGPCQLRLDDVGKRVFGQSLFQAGLRQDAGEQASLGLGQEVGRRAAVVHHRCVDLLQLRIGAHAGKLRRSVAPRHDAEGFVVVPEEAQFTHALQDNRCAAGARRPPRRWHDPALAGCGRHRSRDPHARRHPPPCCWLWRLCCLATVSLAQTASPAQPKAGAGSGKISSLGSAKPGGKLLSREELRACLAQQSELATRKPSIEAQGEKLAGRAPGVAAVGRSAEGRARTVDRLGEEATRLNKRFQDQSAQVNDFNDRVARFQDSGRSGPTAERQRNEFERERQALEASTQALEAERSATQAEGRAGLGLLQHPQRRARQIGRRLERAQRAVHTERPSLRDSTARNGASIAPAARSARTTSRPSCPASSGLRAGRATDQMPICRAARSFMISSEPPPMTMTLTSR